MCVRVSDVYSLCGTKNVNQFRFKVYFANEWVVNDIANGMWCELFDDDDDVYVNVDVDLDADADEMVNIGVDCWKIFRK